MQVGAVEASWRYPVKSLLGEAPPALESVPCLGVYASVVQPGTIEPGAPVVLEPAT